MPTHCRRLRRRTPNDHRTSERSFVRSFVVRSSLLRPSNIQPSIHSNERTDGRTNEGATTTTQHSCLLSDPLLPSLVGVIPHRLLGLGLGLEAASSLLQPMSVERAMTRVLPTTTAIPTAKSKTIPTPTETTNNECNGSYGPSRRRSWMSAVIGQTTRKRRG